MKKARDVLNEIRWREGRNLAKAVLFVRGRTEADVKPVRGAEITELGRRYFSTADATIPFYKIVRITYEGETVFER